MMGLIQTRKGRYKYFNSLEGYDGGDRFHRLWDIVIARGQGMALILVVHEEINMPQMNLLLHVLLVSKTAQVDPVSMHLSDL